MSHFFATDFFLQKLLGGVQKPAVDQDGVRLDAAAQADHRKVQALPPLP